MTRTWQRAALGALCALPVAGCSCGGTVTEPSATPSVRPAARGPALEGWIYFVAERAGEQQHLMRVPAAGGAARTVIAGPGAAFTYGLTPDGRLSVVRGVEGEHDVFTARPDGSDLRPWIVGPGLDWYPRPSPDGAWVLFESNRDAFRELYKMPAAGGDVVRLTDHPAGSFDGVWSPDGRRIAFVSSRAGQLDLWVMDADGGAPTRLTTHPGDVVRPAFSPDGRWLAFISARDGEDELFVIGVDGRGLRNLTPELGRVERFEWAPSGDRLVYAVRAKEAHRFGPTSVRVVVPESGLDTSLSCAGCLDADPTWSPDGRWIAFTSYEAGRPDVWVMAADGSQRSRLTRDPHAAWLPRWVSAPTARATEVQP